jgi:RNA polymerase sigma-70 factor, ECF subfamily
MDPRFQDAMSDSADEDLAASAAAGDRDAFEALVRRYGSHLQAVIQNQVADVERTLDLAQEVWLKVYRALPRYRPEGAFRSWFFAIALNHVRDAARSARRSKVMYLDEFRSPPATAAHLDPRRRTAEKATIEAAMREVNEPFRAAVVLVDVLQLSYEEAAVSLGCRVGTVKSRVNRGRLAFRDEYERLSAAPKVRGTSEGAQP